MKKLLLFASVIALMTSCAKTNITGDAPQAPAAVKGIYFAPSIADDAPASKANFGQSPTDANVFNTKWFSDIDRIGVFSTGAVLSDPVGITVVGAWVGKKGTADPAKYKAYDFKASLSGTNGYFVAASDVDVLTLQDNTAASVRAFWPLGDNDETATTVAGKVTMPALEVQKQMNNEGFGIVENSFMIGEAKVDVDADGKKIYDDNDNSITKQRVDLKFQRTNPVAWFKINIDGKAVAEQPAITNREYVRDYMGAYRLDLNVVTMTNKGAKGVTPKTVGARTGVADAGSALTYGDKATWDMAATNLKDAAAYAVEATSTAAASATTTISSTDDWSNEATAFMAIANVDRAPFRAATKKETVEVKYEFGNSLTYTKSFETDKDWKVNLSDPANSVNWYKCDAVDFDTMAYIVYPYVAPTGSKIATATPVEYVLQINEKFATQGLKIKNLFDNSGNLLTSTGFTTNLGAQIDGTNITHLVSKIDLDAAQFAAVSANLNGLKYVTLLANTKLPANAITQTSVKYFNLPLVSEVAANAITPGVDPTDVYMGSFNFNENAAKHAIFAELCDKNFLVRADVSAVPVIGNKFPFLGLTFMDFTKLEEIRVMNGVILGGQAFMNCTALKVVNYPAVGGAVVLEGDQAFAGCTNLETIATSTTNIPDNSFNGCSLLKNIAPAEGTAGTGVTIKPTTVGVGAFKDCKAITDINLDNATVIKADAFNGCTSLVGRYEADKDRTVLRVNAIKIIEPGSFAGCTHIRFISFKNAKKLSIGCFTGSGIPLSNVAGGGFQEIEFLSIFTVVGNTTATSNLFGGAGTTLNGTKLFIDANQAGKEASVFTIKGDGASAVDCATTFAGIQRNPVL